MGMDLEITPWQADGWITHDDQGAREGRRRSV